ncbi:hypothetical protein [Phormidium sp. CCY1219]|uniref:hypothetical protein n=1 Tax=Phormidium sp. CCY1219 TaxID=2886104 RepID=UPI002D1F09C0|nr:hypothetical protein [Phormidium sp. CCY1219]MEB3830612.1 hypothetical protein [Phormidium sp. CCY1219]
MQSIANFFKSISQASRIKLIVALFFLLWTFLLGIKTWEIQQSDHPMISPKTAPFVEEKLDWKKLKKMISPKTAPFVEEKLDWKKLKNSLYRQFNDIVNSYRNKN